MSRGSVTIDGVDIADMGMFILKGGDYDFLQFPERKSPEQNSWSEFNGVDVDLSEIFFKEKKVTPRFYIKADTGDEFLFNLNRFHSLIGSPGYRQLYSREFGKTFSLRYVSSPAFNHRGGLYKPGRKWAELSVEFMMDDPLQVFTGSGHTEPRNGRTSRTYVTINGRDLADFGVIVNQCYNTVLPLPSAKAPLTRSISNVNGLIYYPPNEMTFEVKRLAIECTMMADNRDDFYYNYEALFNNLSIKEAVELTTFSYDDVPCYYQNMSGFQKVRPFGSRVLVKFTLTFVQIDSGLINYILGMEDDISATITENGNYFIGI